ncbi:MAG TPA: hypothetical protein VF290_19670, partial [Pyrinomonadaceae bacterium]
MIANEFLNVVANHLQSAGLVPAPKTIGVAEPVIDTELPAVVLSLQRIRKLGNGLGERSTLITDGSLPWTAAIDLENPVLPEEPSFRLLSQDRRELVLPHGGLVRADGSQGPLSPQDLSVSVAEVARAVVTGNPVGAEVKADPLVGRLFFGSPLPVTGIVRANYFLGQWEQRTSRIAGMLRVGVRDTSSATVSDLSGRVVDALQPPKSLTITGLHSMTVIKLGSIQPPEAGLANSRARIALFSFEFELEINRPESSGGIILRIPVEDNID